MKQAVAFVRARTAGKVLETGGSWPSIVFMVKRLQRAVTLDEVVVVSSDDPSDDKLAEAFLQADITVCLGALNDVAARFQGAFEEYASDEVVRVARDCPLLDPAVDDAVVTLRRQTGADYASNVDPPTFPDGMDVEVFTESSLREASAAVCLPSDREHVTPWMR